MPKSSACAVIQNVRKLIEAGIAFTGADYTVASNQLRKLTVINRL